MSHHHRPDRRLRLVAVLLVSVAASFASSTLTLSLMLALALISSVILLSVRPNNSFRLIRRMLVVNMFVVLIWLTVALDWRSMTFTPSGITLATQLSLRINLITLASLLLLTGMTALDLARAASGLGLPRALGSLLTMSIRQIALLGETQQKIQLAIRARAYRPRIHWHTIRVSAQQVAWLIIHALLRAQRTELGLKARGLDTFPVLLRPAQPWRLLPRSEWYFLAGTALAVITAIAAAEILKRS